MQSGLFRIAVSTYSETAFREALANALIHRDYTRPGAVHVQWREEQLEISSPGGFLRHVRYHRHAEGVLAPRLVILPRAAEIQCRPRASRRRLSGLGDRRSHGTTITWMSR